MDGKVWYMDFLYTCNTNFGMVMGEQNYIKGYQADQVITITTV